MPEITEEQLAEWMALCDAATEGPWEGHVSRPNMGGGRSIPQVFGGPDDISVLEAWDSANGDYDILFAAAARTAMPALIAALREARERHERLLGGFGDLQELLNALAVEQAKVKRLRQAIGIYAEYDYRGQPINGPARVLKETEDGT